MSQEQKSESQIVPEAHQVNFVPVHRDWFLQLLVGIANKNTDESFVEYPITLQVGGLLVSGHLTSGRNYFEGFADELKTGFDKVPALQESDNEKFVSPFRMIAKEFYDNSEELTDEQVEASNNPGFIHLRNARVFHPNGTPIPINKPVWWRGRLDAVDAFFLGGLD